MTAVDTNSLQEYLLRNLRPLSLFSSRVYPCFFVSIYKPREVDKILRLALGNFLIRYTGKQLCPFKLLGPTAFTQTFSGAVVVDFGLRLGKRCKEKEHSFTPDIYEILEFITVNIVYKNL